MNNAIYHGGGLAMKGAAGAAGAAGPAGTRGSAWYTGVGVPGVIPGQLNGDMYLDTAANNVYQLIAGVWTLLCNIKGATGATGAAGLNSIIYGGTSNLNGAYTPDLSLGNYFILNSTGNGTINLPTNIGANYTVSFYIKFTGTVYTVNLSAYNFSASLPNPDTAGEFTINTGNWLQFALIAGAINKWIYSGEVLGYSGV